jgi:poly(3-hydroxybutyrate) depolymerase
MVGCDNGGFMANILADRHPDVFAAIGVVSAAGVELKTPVSVIHVHCMNDPVSLIGGNEKFEALDELLAKINAHNGASKDTVVMKTGSVTGSFWEGKTNDAASYVAEDLGH